MGGTGRTPGAPTEDAAGPTGRQHNAVGRDDGTSLDTDAARSAIAHLDRDGARIHPDDAAVTLDRLFEEPVQRPTRPVPARVVDATGRVAPFQRGARALVEPHRPAPAASGSAACGSGESSPSATAATPPWAHAVALSSAAPGATTVTAPRSEACSADHRPAAPAPRTTVRVLTR